jgi:hypothetical protein
MNAATRSLVSMRNPSQVAELAGRLAILANGATILLLVTLHVLSSEFSPSWRMVSEYAFGQYAWVLSLMFLSWGIGSWALAVATWSPGQYQSRKARPVVSGHRWYWRGDGFLLRHQEFHRAWDRWSAWGYRLPHCSLAAERCSRSQRNVEHGTKATPLDREPKLDQCRPAHGHTRSPAFT